MFIQQLMRIGLKPVLDTLNISIVGGSNSVMRRGYCKYLNSYITQASSCQTTLKYYSLGGVPNIFGTIQQERYDIAANSDIIFFEYCVNDRHAIEVDHFSLDAAGKSLEGFIRKVQQSNPNCLIVILIFGINLEDFYQNHCHLSELYESIGKYYNLPVINITELLKQSFDLDYVKSLYNEKDHAHYTRPEGVQIVSQTIVEELSKTIKLKSFTKEQKFKKNKHNLIEPIYTDNLENLSFIEQFENGKYFKKTPKVSVYQNTVFREKHYTITQNNSLDFLLKGELLAIFVKSDLSDGLIKVEFNQQHVITSSYSSWVNKIKPQNILSLISSPLRKLNKSSDFAPVSISLCPDYPEQFEIGYEKAPPTKSDPHKWKLSIIGIAYIGEIKPLN